MFTTGVGLVQISEGGVNLTPVWTHISAQVRSDNIKVMYTLSILELNSPCPDFFFCVFNSRNRLSAGKRQVSIKNLKVYPKSRKAKANCTVVNILFEFEGNVSNHLPPLSVNGVSEPLQKNIRKNYKPC